MVVAEVNRYASATVVADLFSGITAQTDSVRANCAPSEQPCRRPLVAQLALGTQVQNMRTAICKGSQATLTMHSGRKVALGNLRKNLFTVLAANYAPTLKARHSS